MSTEGPSAESLAEAARRIASDENRAAFLDQACGADLPLRQRIERLLSPASAESGASEEPGSNLVATIVTRVEVPDRSAALQAGLAAVFPVEGAAIDGDVSVLRALGQTICVKLRDASQDGHEPIVRPMSPEMPDRDADSRYRLDGEIARGGMGAILKGRDTDLGRDLAIKVLLEAHKDKPDVVQRFIEEAQIGGQLQHPGIAPIYELGQFADKRPFFAMKLVKGETLASLLAARTDPAAERGRFLGIFEQICQTVAYAHSRSVIHRDLKPANIMVGAFGEVQVMDWGLAKVLPVGGVADEKKSRRKQNETSVVRTVRSIDGDGPGRFGTVGSQTLMGSVMGTPAYMPPEQALGEIDHLDERSDVFGLGAILCEILTGKPPYVADNGTQIYRLASRGQLEDCYARLDASGAEPELLALAKRCLEREPQNRPNDAGALAQQVAAYQASVETRLRKAELERAAQAARADAQAAQAKAEGKRAQAESERAEAERQRAESETRRVEQQQRSSSKLRKLAAGLALVALLAALACGAALFANSRANHLAKVASEREADAQASAADAQASAADAQASAAAAQASAADAERERTAAVQSQQETADALVQVEAQKERADREAELVRQNLYYAQMHLAQKAWREHRGLSRMRTLLADWVPEDGSVDRRGWEWFYLHSLPHQNVRVLSDPAPIGLSPVVAWHLPSDRLAEGLGDGTIRIWNGDDGQPALVLQAPPPANLRDGSRWIAWSPEGDLLAAGCSDGTLRLWESVGGAELHVLPGHASSIRSVAFSSDGSRVAVWMENGGIRIWEVETQQVTADIVHPGGVARGAWSPDDKLLACVHGNGDLTLSGTQPDHRIVTLQHPGGLNDLAWSPDSARLATVGSGDFSARVWDVASGELVLDQLSHSHIVLSAAWEPDGSRLATGSADQTVKIWDATTGRERNTLRGHSEAVTSLAWGPDASLAAGCADGSTRIWESIGQQESHAFAAHDSRATFVAWSPDGRRLATGSDDGKLHVRNADAFEEVQTIDPAFGPVRVLAWSPDSKRIAAAGWDGPAKLQVWDAESDREVVAIAEDLGAIECLAWNLDGTRLAVGSRDGMIRLIDALGEMPTVFAFQAHDGPVRSLAWNPEGDRLASGGGADDWTGDKLVKLWDPSSGAELARFEGHGGPVVQVAWSPDGGRLATASHDGTAIEWDAATGQPIVTMRGHNDWLTGIAWSPDGERLATSGLDNSVRIWDPRTGVETLVLEGDATMFRAIAWHPDGARLAAAGEQGRAWIWDATRGFERDTTARALPFIERRIASGTAGRGDERRVAEAYAEAGNFREAIAVYQNDREGLVELAGRFDQRGEPTLAAEARVQLRALLERRLEAEPASEETASWLAELLLADQNDGWTLLEPTAMESSGGATLTKQGDGSVLASGTNASGDVYTLRVDCPVDRIAAIRLEALPDPSLPGAGPGRHESGNFQLSAFRVSYVPSPGTDDATPIVLASADASYEYRAPDAGIEGMTDETLDKVWHVYGRPGKAHWAVFFVESPSAKSSNRPLAIELHHKDVGAGLNLGRFRLSVREDAERERERFAARKLSDPWSRLAAAYRLQGDHEALKGLLERRPTAADDLPPPAATEE